ncbi:MAG: TonB-dependent receptor [Gemmatimonadaceae bacterium]|nr:TonB-dependent receptor [Gemmatimonadaceae bacterium]
MGVFNHPLLDLLPVRAVGRIVVHKGPQPAATGNTFAAIELDSRRVERDGTHGSVALAAGGFGTVMQDADLGVRRGGFRLSLSQSMARSDGHRERAGGRLASGVVRAEYDLRDGLVAFATVLHGDNRADDPGIDGQPATRAGRYRTRATMVTAGVRHERGRVRGAIQVYRSGGSGDWFDQPAPDGDTFTDFTLSGLRVREAIAAWPGGTVHANLDVDLLRGASVFDRVAPAAPGRFDSPTFRLVQPYLGVVQRVAVGDAWTLVPSVGVRTYAHDEFGSATAPHLGVVLEHRAGLTLRANASRGINYPGLDVVVLSSLIPPLARSWPFLRPERLDHVELGLQLTRTTAGRRVTVDGAVFEDRVRDRYVFATPPRAVPPRFQNLGDFTVRGAEAAIRADAGHGIALFGAGTWLVPTLASLPNAPARTLAAGATLDRRLLRLAVDVQSQTRMLVGPFGRNVAAVNATGVDGFTLWHISATVPVAHRGRTHELFANVENALGARYAYLPGYPMPRGWVTAGARTTF